MISKDIPIVDTHHHLCDLEHNYYPWLMDEPMWRRVLGDYTALRRSYLIDEYLADARPENVVKSVHLQMGWDFARPVEETRWLQGVADKHGFPQAIVGFARLEAPDIDAVLDGHSQFANFRGIRQILNWDPDPVRTFVDRDDYMTDPRWLDGFGKLARRRLSFDLQIYPSQMEAAAKLARRFSDTQIILDHIGMPIDRDEESLAVWRKGMRLLAEAPNVTVKISALGVANPGWTIEGVRPLVLHVVDCFGPDRCVVGSNYPVDRLTNTYAENFEAMRTILAPFAESEQRAILHDNALRVYRI